MTESKGFMVGELVELLKDFSDDLPVIISGYESNYEYIRPPTVLNVPHLPDN